MVKHGKPAPDLFLHAANAMRADPSRCVVVEDSPAGIEAAKRAGMRVFGFAGGTHAPAGVWRRSYTRWPPDAIFDDMRRLPSLLERLGTGASVGGHERAISAPSMSAPAARAPASSIPKGCFSPGRRPIRHEPPQAEPRRSTIPKDIWRAVCISVRAALEASGIDPAQVVGARLRRDLLARRPRS